MELRTSGVCWLENLTILIYWGSAGGNLIDRKVNRKTHF